MSITSPAKPVRSAPRAVPELENGDRLTRVEFERRYDAMPDLKRAELIEGVVYMPSPVRLDRHGEPHGNVITWQGVYRAATPGVRGGDNTSVRLDQDNMPQPDALLLLPPHAGGQARVSDDGFVEGAPELIAEVAPSSVSYDLGPKLDAYRRNGVREYLVWRVLDEAFDWFELREGRYEPQSPDADGLLKSALFPGLWLDPQALLAGDLAKVLAVLNQGTASAEHAAFVKKLEAPAT